MIENQDHKAKITVLQLRLEQIKRHHAFMMHQKARKWVTKYNLPYRISLDYLKQYDLASGIVLINECYPKPGYPKDGVLHLGINDMDVNNPDCYEERDGKRIQNINTFKTPLPAAAQKIEMNNQRFRTWNLQTEEGREEWERQFAHFLDGYDLDSFSSWDMFGVPDAPDDVLEALRRYLKGVLLRYRDSKTASRTSYRTEEPPYLPEYDELYTTQKFLLNIKQM